MSRQEVKVMVTNIEWDLEDEEQPEYGTDIVTDTDHLPTEDVLMIEWNEENDEDELVEQIFDTLADCYGFLVSDFDYEIL